MILRLPVAVLSAALLAGAAFAQASPGLSDAQIAHVAYTAGQIDISAAEQALRKSKTPKVRAFAQTMVRDHSEVNAQALALAKRLGVTPQANATSTALSDQASAKSAELAKLDGAAFDRAYVANEVAYHGAVNSALSDTLIPSARSADLKGLLQAGLRLFQAHQHHAEQIAREIR